MKKISVVLGDYPHGRALLSGDVPVDGFAVEPVTVNPIIGAYRRMIRDLKFDVCELAPTSYLMARDRGMPLTAIPVFLNRRFHHGDIQCAASSGIAVPGPGGTQDRGARLLGDHWCLGTRHPQRGVRRGHPPGHLGRR